MLYTDDYWQERFRLHPELPQRVKNAIKAVYSSYPPECMPQGLCDPMNIMNVIAYELGIGDGKSNFTLPFDKGIKL